jgi:hypothetical protein
MMPSFWFVETVRKLSPDTSNSVWGGVVLKLATVGVAFIIVAALLFRRRFNKGLRV